MNDPKVAKTRATRWINRILIIYENDCNRAVTNLLLRCAGFMGSLPLEAAKT